MNKIIFREYKIILLILLSFSFLSCTNNHNNPNNNLNKYLLSYSVIKYINNDVEKANKINKILLYVKNTIREDKLVSLSILEYEIKQQINWEKLIPEEQFLLLELFNYVQDYLSQYKEYQYVYLEQIIDVMLKTTNEFILLH